MTRARLSLTLALTALAGGLILQGCERGPAEKAGEKLDSAIEQAGGGPKDLTDGPAEKAGEKIDKATKDAGAAVNSAADKAGAATDPNK